MEYKKENPLKEILNKKQVLHNNRGMNLENDINMSNQYYIDTKQAFIYKKPTPIKILKVNYPSKTNKTGKITIKEAYFEAPSTTDYNGLYKGKYIDFEAKETKNKTAFPLANIHSHQIKHIKNIYNHQGIVFLIVRFIHYNETYLLLGKDFLEFIEKESRKSIPYAFFQKKGYLIKDGYRPRIDYLKIVDTIIGGI